MDETLVRGLLETALGDEPPIGPVARNSLLAGIRLRRRARMRRAVSGAAAVAVVAAVIPAATGVFGNTSAGPRTGAPPSIPKVPTVPTGTAYVINSGGGTVTPIDLATNTAGKPIDVPGEPVALAAAPDGKMAYVDTGATTSRPGLSSDQTVTPIDLTTNTTEKSIILTNPADAMAIAPGAKTAYVINGFPSRTVTRINLATNTAEKPIDLSAEPEEIAMAPDGNTAYLAVAASTKVKPGSKITVRGPVQYDFIPFNLATNKLGKPVKLGSEQPQAIAIASDGKTAYVVSQSSSTVIAVTPIDLTTLKTEKPIKISTKPGPTKGYYGQPLAIAIAPDGITAYVADGALSTMTPINLVTDTPGRPISLSGKAGADAIAISSNGAAAYVANQPSSTVTPINLTTLKTEKPIKIGSGWDSGFEAIVTVP
jgi:DNA-binding beta-propeller fold protein YncE